MINVLLVKDHLCGTMPVVHARFLSYFLSIPGQCWSLVFFASGESFETWQLTPIVSLQATYNQRILAAHQAKHRLCS